jgi:hypothetical protein
MAVESRGTNPFEVEVQEIINILRTFLPNWKALNDLVLDVETLNRIASIVKLQGEWLKRRSTSLFVDPLLVEVKIKIMKLQRLIEIFLRSWHPIIEMEFVSGGRLEKAIEYWNSLLPLKERRLRLPAPSNNLGSITREELIKRKIASEESFKKVLDKLWIELKSISSNGKIEYWKFINAETYAETVNRALLVSFLVTYGYVSMEINPLNDEVFLIPNSEITSYKEKQKKSIPISIDYESWKKREKLNYE